MKKTLITAVALAACAGTQLFAQNAKQDVITFSLTRYAQVSVSTSTAANAGNWSDGPTIYKTTSYKIATADVIQAIAEVLHGNPGYYGSRSQLVLVQGELGGFFGYPYVNTLDSNDTTDGDNIRLATGRNMTYNPITGALPPGQNQPWGQVYVKTYNALGQVILCENVSFFFAFRVEECYDCFYLNSFISDTTFRFTQKTGPPCCAGTSLTSGKGTDKYYMTLQFDNTINNPYLNPYGSATIQAVSGSTVTDESVAGSTNVLTVDTDDFYAQVGGVDGLYPPVGHFFVTGLVERDNGVNPDGLPYSDPILTSVHTPLDAHAYDIYTMRFALNGIVTYSWNLKFINSTDPFPDFLGTAGMPVTGYGYVQKVCSLLSGSVTFTEGVVATTKCCLDEPWNNPGGGQDGGFWYGIGDFDIASNLGTGDPGDIENYYDSNVAGTISTGHLGDEVPVNTDLDLSFHANFNYDYEPLREAINGDYPQPGFEGSWTDEADASISPSDVQTPQGDTRAADGSAD
jgi:hypothetical protein